ncbi:MAG: hypothetical protein KIS73_26030 [Enhydrobacter sp.]|nr:hypothetical protein [Enhydrobacter sp.]
MPAAVIPVTADRTALGIKAVTFRASDPEMPPPTLKADGARRRMTTHELGETICLSTHFGLPRKETPLREALDTIANALLRLNR